MAQVAGMGLIRNTTAREARLAAELLVWRRSRVAAPGGRPAPTPIEVRWPLEPLELCALRGVAGTMVGWDQLIAAAPDALLSGADSPALRQLAGLTRSEEPDAQDLFDQTVEELGIASTLPLEPTLERARDSGHPRRRAIQSAQPITAPWRVRCGEDPE